MPNVTLFIPQDSMPEPTALSSLTAQCTELCIDTLKAAPGNVHVIYVPVLHGRGHPVFAEIQYRLEAFRTPQVMEQFMQGLDDAIRHTIGLTPRIRCFGYAGSNIHARN